MGGLDLVMRYMGGKVRIARWVEAHLARYAARNHRYLEPFVGGGAILERLAGRFPIVEAGDIHLDLILMWRAVQAGWSPPTRVSRGTYEALRHAEPSALRGFVGYGASFGGKWFGGYADRVWDAHHRRYTKPYAQTAARSLVRAADAIRHVDFQCASYERWNPRPGTLVYCDPPYQGTLGAEGFDHEAFWRVAEAWVRAGADVVVSEAGAPEGWGVLGERSRAHLLRVASSTQQVQRVERLFAPCPSLSRAAWTS